MVKRISSEPPPLLQQASKPEMCQDVATSSVPAQSCSLSNSRLRLCPSGHTLLALGSAQRPLGSAEYNEWCCDAPGCSSGSFTALAAARFHCAECRYDVCEFCCANVGASLMKRKTCQAAPPPLSQQRVQHETQPLGTHQFSAPARPRAATRKRTGASPHRAPLPGPRNPARSMPASTLPKRRPLVARPPLSHVNADKSQYQQQLVECRQPAPQDLSQSPRLLEADEEECQRHQQLVEFYQRRFDALVEEGKVAAARGVVGIDSDAKQARQGLGTNTIGAKATVAMCKRSRSLDVRELHCSGTCTSTLPSKDMDANFGVTTGASRASTPSSSKAKDDREGVAASLRRLPVVTPRLTTGTATGKESRAVTVIAAVGPRRRPAHHSAPPRRQVEELLPPVEVATKSEGTCCPKTMDKSKPCRQLTGSTASWLHAAETPMQRRDPPLRTGRGAVHLLRGAPLDVLGADPVVADMSCSSQSPRAGGPAASCVASLAQLSQPRPQQQSQRPTPALAIPLSPASSASVQLATPRILMEQSTPRLVTGAPLSPLGKPQTPSHPGVLASAATLQDTRSSAAAARQLPALHASLGIESLLTSTGVPLGEVAGDYLEPAACPAVLNTHASPCHAGDNSAASTKIARRPPPAPPTCFGPMGGKASSTVLGALLGEIDTRRELESLERQHLVVPCGN